MRLKLLLRPGWLLLALVVVLFAVTCFTLLAPWQFGRNSERQATNTALESSTDSAPVPLREVLAAGQTPDNSTEWRRVTLRGAYEPAGGAVARLRTVQGNAAFEVLTPFRLDDGTHVLVNRGYVRPVGGVRVPSFAAAPTGPVDLTARIRVDERDTRPAFQDATTDGHRQVYGINSRVVGDAANIPLAPGYLQLEEGSPGVLSALPLPQREAGPFFSYALQWIAFGTMGILGLIYFTWREIKPGGALAQSRPKKLSVAEQLAQDEEYTRT
ncbi:SURF1 family cytochrome oxidase biogenesis protein [Actinokineospora pegani]|uniref:SURF1 family cytochrome oxidase biogenesis protein n=1 Tax=Actinokineospora pegani TaxID=2654637 RepID=UPI0012E9FFD8|nr:SURF1 family cytochrome oxidase biogenesis protein [Actinokineospora pegani]